MEGELSVPLRTYIRSVTMHCLTTHSALSIVCDVLVPRFPMAVARFTTLPAGLRYPCPSVLAFLAVIPVRISPTVNVLLQLLFSLCAGSDKAQHPGEKIEDNGLMPLHGM